MENAKVVTIITDFEARDLVLAGFEDLGVRSFSSTHVEGVGVHGEKRTGLNETKNLEYVVVASEALAASLLAWVQDRLLPRYPSIAFSTDAFVVSAKPLP
jgi:hypothetical protein